jgi:hypothetical protein
VLRRNLALCAVVCLAFPAVTSGAATGYSFVGGTRAERQTVVAALEASSFDWSRLPQPITVHIAHGVESHSVPRHVWLDANLLASGTFAWGVVQHEFAHQVDYLLLDDQRRALLLDRLGGRDWCYDVPGLRHDQYGCERFASTLAWTFWPSPENCMRPTRPRDESGALPPAKFRALIASLLASDDPGSLSFKDHGPEAP